MPQQIEAQLVKPGPGYQEWTQAGRIDDLQERFSHTLETSGRRLRTGLDLLKQPEYLVPLGALTLLVAGTMANEVSILSRSGEIDAAFAANYFKYNFLPSIIWAAPPPDILAIAAGRGAEIINNLDPDFIRSLPSDLQQLPAQQLLDLLQSQYLRWVFTGSLFLGNIVASFGIGKEANRIMTEKILDGKEPMFRLDRILRGKKERIIRLAGKRSDVTEYDMGLDGDHFLPIHEDLGVIKLLIARYTKHGTVPAVWRIPDHDYDEDDEWTNFNIPKEWLVKTKNGAKLIVEADASVGEQALALGPESANDLDLQEVSQAADSLRNILAKDRITADLITILLADSQKIIGRGNDGTSYSLREQNDVLKNVDIIIDAKAPLLKAVLQWAEQMTNNGDKTVVFVTTNDLYFETVKNVLAKFGFSVIRWSPHDSLDPEIPHLVYENITADTMDTTRRLIEYDKVAPAKCCPLIDRQSGLEKFERLKGDLKKKDKQINNYVCSAQIYSDLFRLVRFWIRLGVDNSTIQQYLDTEWKPVLDALSS